MAINEEALLRVAEILDTVKPKRFDLGSWVGRKTRSQLLVSRALRKIGFGRHACGTTACAIGYAASDKWFTSRGFVLQEPELGCLFPFYEGAKGFNAVMIFFDLGYSDAEMLFHPDSYSSSVTPKEVAERIRHFVANNKSA